MFFLFHHRMDTAQKIIALVMVMSLSLLGCSTKAPRGYLKRGVTASQIRTIALLPFDNISGHPDAGKKVTNLLLTELANTEMFEIAEVGEVENTLRDLRVRTTAELNSSKRQNLGEHLNVRVIIVGSVDEYEARQARSGTVPVVSISARMLDVQTGDILWTISHTHDGNDWETVFGFGKIISLSQLAQIVISEMVESLVQELRPGFVRFPSDDILPGKTVPEEYREIPQQSSQSKTQTEKTEGIGTQDTAVENNVVSNKVTKFESHILRIMEDSFYINRFPGAKKGMEFTIAKPEQNITARVRVITTYKLMLEVKLLISEDKRHLTSIGEKVNSIVSGQK